MVNHDDSLNEVIIAGFGGQGILSMGRLIAYAGLLEDKNVSWLPSYGPEMRGGTANCAVVVSDELVSSPILNACNALIVMNGPSLDKFESFVLPGGVIIVDSSLVARASTRTDVKFIRIPATQLANEAGNKTYAGILLLGALIGETNLVTLDSFEKALKGVLPKKKHFMIPEEMEMLKKGMSF